MRYLLLIAFISINSLVFCCNSCTNEESNSIQEIWLYLSTPIGVLLGVIVTKSYDYFIKEKEYKLDERKLIFSEKLKVGSDAVNFIQTFNDNLSQISTIITQHLGDDSTNPNFFDAVWENCHINIFELSKKSMEYLNRVYFFYDIKHFDYSKVNLEFGICISDIRNIQENEKYEELNIALINYSNSIDKLVGLNSQVIQSLINELKETK